MTDTEIARLHGLEHSVSMLAMLVEQFADAAGIDLDDTRISVTSNGGEIAAVSVRKIIDKSRATLTASEQS